MHTTHTYLRDKHWNLHLPLIRNKMWVDSATVSSLA